MASGIGTASGAITLTGLPYTVDVRTPIELWADSWVNAPLWGDANPGATTAVLVKSRLAGGNGTNIIATDFSATTSWNVLTFQFSYKHA